MYEKILNLTRDWKKSTTLRLFFLSQDYQKYLKVPPWLVWLSRLGIVPQTEGSPVRFHIRALAWVADEVPGWGARERQVIDVFSSSFPPSHPLSVKINK